MLSRSPIARGVTPLLLAMAAALPSCASETAQPGPSGDSSDEASTALSFNDISILWQVPPLSDRDDPRFEEWLPRIRSSQSSASLISAAALKLALSHGASAPALADLQDEYQAEFTDADWRVVSVRFDPRFLLRLPDDPSAPSKSMLRLVAQPFSDRGLADGGLHLVYLVDPVAVTRDLIKLKAASRVATDGRLGVHPGLADEWATGEGTFSQELKKLLNRHCNAKNLVSINLSVSLAGTGPGDVITLYAAFVPDAQGKFAPTTPPAFADQTAQHQVATTNHTDGKTTVIPGARVPDHVLDDLDAVLFPTLQTATPERIESMLTRAYRIEDPRAHTLATTDCISCHISTQVLSGAEQLLAGATDRLKAARSSRYTLKRAELAPTEVKSDVSAFRNFGWSPGIGGQPVPTVSQRTVNETDRCLPLVQALDLGPS